MDLTMYQLRTFSDVARTGSLTKSARNLGYSQSSVTAHVRSLELRVGAPLFQRLPHGVRLTRAGEMFRGYANRILDVVEEMSSALQQKGEAVGQVTVGATAALIEYPVPSLVTEAQHRYPRVRVSPRVVASTDVVSLVMDGEVDIALVLSDCESGSAFQGKGVSSLDLFPLELVPVSAADTSSIRTDAGTATGVAREVRIVAADSGCASQAVLAGALKQRYGVEATVLETGSIGSARELVLSGMGIAMLPVSAVEKAIAAGELVELGDLPRARLFAKAVWPDQDWISPAVSAMLDLVRRQKSEPRQFVGAN